MRANLLVVMLAVCGLSAPLSAAGPDTDAFLGSGKFDEGIAALEAHLKDQPKDDTARFGLGAIQFVQAVKQLGQKVAIYGLRPNGNAELNRLFPDVPKPDELLTYPRLRQITREWIDDLAGVDRTLALIEGENVKMPLHVARIPLALARAETQALTLVPLLQMFQIGQRGREADLVIAFDRADVDWLRGYCHLLAALGEIGLAYDGQELFDVFAHRVFIHTTTPYKFLLEEARPRPPGSWFDFEQIADVIAAIHVLRFPVVEPKRMPVALAHIEQTLALSRQMWKRTQQETDDDREWIPSPKQRGALGVGVTQEMVDQWIVALDETESILQGKKLLPFWRGKTIRGVNLRKAFMEPRALDLVLWVQGTAAAPYLEEGELTRPDTWEKINQAFRGQFLAFGVWFN